MVGAIVGGVEGYESGKLQGQCGWDLAISAGLGALAGAAVGALDPTEGVLTAGRIVAIGAIAGGVGDLAGQLYGNGFSISNVGPFELAGATLGGAASTGFGMWGAAVASTELGGLAVGTAAGVGPATY